MFSMLVAYFDSLISKIRLRSKHESCSFVSLEYAYEISAHLDEYNFIYGVISTNYPILDSLYCISYFVEIENDFGRKLNMKIVDNLLN